MLNHLSEHYSHGAGQHADFTCSEHARLTFMQGQESAQTTPPLPQAQESELTPQRPRRRQLPAWATRAAAEHAPGAAHTPGASPAVAATAPAAAAAMAATARSRPPLWAPQPQPRGTNPWHAGWSLPESYHLTDAATAVLSRAHGVFWLPGC